jgi:hypothetical protein
MYPLGVRVRKIRIRHIYDTGKNHYAMHYVISSKKLIYRKLKERNWSHRHLEPSRRRRKMFGYHLKKNARGNLGKQNN